MEMLLVFVLTVAFLGLMMILAFGWQGIEAERALQAKAAAQALPDVVRGRRFFLRPGEAGAASADALDETSINRFEEYLRAEQSVAAEFVSQPSVERLYSDSRN